MRRWLRRLRKREEQPAPDPRDAEREFRANFQGRRTGTRIRVHADVLLGNTDRPYRCETIDVSRTGCLLAFRDPRCREWDLSGYMQFLDEHLSDGAKLRINGIERDVVVVRVTQGGLGGSDVPQFACRFDTPISAGDLAALLHATRAAREE